MGGREENKTVEDREGFHMYLKVYLEGLCRAVSLRIGGRVGSKSLLFLK